MLVAETAAPDSEGGQIVGVGHSPSFRRKCRRIALIVCDRHQGRGIGTELMRRLLRAAKRRTALRLRPHPDQQHLDATTLPAAGMTISDCPGGEVKAVLDLGGPAA